MLNAFVFHAERNLDQNASRFSRREQFAKFRFVELVAMIVWKEPDTGHQILFMTAAKVLLPIREFWINRAEGKKDVAAMLLTLSGESFVYSGDVFVPQRIEAAGPGLHHTGTFQFRDQFSCFVERQPAEWPVGKRDVGVDDTV